MNVISPTLAATAIGLGSTSVYLYSQLDAERSRPSTQGMACRDERAQIAASQEACVAFDPNAMPDEVQPRPVDPWEDRSGEPATSRFVGADHSAPAQGLPAEAGGREFSRPRQEAALRRIYRGLAQELNLLPEQEAQLLNALLEQHISQELSEQRQGNETELMSLLGDKYLEFEDYRKSLAERMQIEQAALQLEAAGVPLRENQRKNLLAVMVDESDRIPRPPWISDASFQENRAKQEEWQADYNERVRERVGSVLTSEQLKQYDVHRNLQSTLRQRQREQLEMWRETRRPLTLPGSPGPS